MGPYSRCGVDLNDIIMPIKEETRIFNREFKAAIRSNVGIVDTIARYLLHQKGKKIRPILVLLSAKASGGINQRTYHAATLVELLHTAAWKNKAAVLMGDYLLARGLILSLVHDEYEFLKISSVAVKRMSEGELLQIQKSRQLDMDESTYFKIISDKTASFISSCCEMGAASATSDNKIIGHLRAFGEFLGIAFQIQDDILDYEGKGATLGKPIASDIRERKITLPFIYAFSSAPKREAKSVLRLLKNGKRGSRISEVIEFTERYNGINRARQKSVEFARNARNELREIQDSAAKQALLGLAEFVVERVN